MTEPNQPKPPRWRSLSAVPSSTPTWRRTGSGSGSLHRVRPRDTPAKYHVDALLATLADTLVGPADLRDTSCMTRSLARNSARVIPSPMASTARRAMRTGRWCSSGASRSSSCRSTVCRRCGQGAGPGRDVGADGGTRAEKPVITKVVHGSRVGRLIAYLMGPERAQEHVRPRVITT